MVDVTNADRAAWAAQALSAYKGSHQCEGDDKAIIRDLIGDLLHLVRRQFGLNQDDLYHLSRSAADMQFAEAIEDPEE